MSMTTQSAARDKEAEDKSARDKAARDRAAASQRTGTKEGEEAPPIIVGYPDRSEVGQTAEEAAANQAANDRVTAENQRMADEAAPEAAATGQTNPTMIAEGTAPGTMAPKKTTPNGDDDDDDDDDKARARRQQTGRR